MVCSLVLVVLDSGLGSYLSCAQDNDFVEIFAGDGEVTKRFREANLGWCFLFCLRAG